MFRRRIGWTMGVSLLLISIAVAGGLGWLAHEGQTPADLTRFFDGDKPSAPEPPQSTSPDDEPGCEDVGTPDPARLGAEVSGWPPGFESTELHHLLEQYNTPVLMVAYKTNFDHALPSQAQNIALTATRLAGTVLSPGEVFSQNRRLGPYTAERGYGEGRMFAGGRVVPSIGGGVCQIATTLYNAVILADLQVVERHNHSMTVPYVPPGQDATVADGYLDFRFKNSSDAPLVIWASTKDRWLYIGLFGRTAPPQVEWHHEQLSKTPHPVEIKPTSELAPGEERLMAKGLDGVVVRSWLTIGTPEQQQIKSLGIDTYQASPRIIERGPSD